MKRWLPVGLVVLGICAAVGLYATFVSSDERKIRGQLVDLAEAVRIDDGELNPLVRHRRLSTELAEIVSEDASVSVEEVGEELRGRAEIIGAAAQLAAVYQSADVSFDRVNVRIDPSGATARATATAALLGAPHGQQPKREERRVTFQLSKIKGDWRIKSATVAPREAPGDEEP